MSQPDIKAQSFNFVKLFLKYSNKVPVKEIKEKYGFNKKRTARVTILDAERSFDFDMAEEKVRLFLKPQKADIDIIIIKLSILKSLRRGYKIGINPATKEVVEIPYTPFDAWISGDVKTYGEASTNDVHASIEILTELIKVIPTEEIEAVILGE